MRVDEARKVLLVRAVETMDVERMLLSDSMRRQASLRARGELDPRVDQEAFLSGVPTGSTSRLQVSRRPCDLRAGRLDTLFH